MRRTSTLVLLAAAVALIAAGCGSSDNDNKSSGSAAATTAAPAPAYAPKTTAESGKGTEVRVENFAFSPATEKVKVGQEIEWENYDSVSHNVVATSGGTFKSPTLPKSAKFKFTPTKPGTISYVCTFHPNMKATLEVTQ